MMLKRIVFIGAVITIGCVQRKCWHKTCEIRPGEYKRCYQEWNYCVPYDRVRRIVGSCVYVGENSHDRGSVTCDSSQLCTISSNTGQAKCVDVTTGDRNDSREGIGTGPIILIVFASFTIVMGLIYRFMSGTGCRSSVAYDEPIEAVQTTPQPQRSPPPATRYSPEQFLPASGYPPASSSEPFPTKPPPSYELCFEPTDNPYVLAFRS